LRLEGGFKIERCDQCLGIFFDPGELGVILDRSVDRVFDVDHERMATLIEEEGILQPTTVRYVKCPTCGELMNRRRYGARSGVVADTCKRHGVWLDGGELGQLLKWAKAGGEIFTEQKRHEEERRRRVRQERLRREALEGRVSALHSAHRHPSDADLFAGLVGTLVRMLR
jgi:Zn-finger nucleic acid-binding protein